MRFKDLHIFREKRFTVGVEEETGRYYLSIPVANRRIDYDEYYEISRELAEAAPGNREELEHLVAQCRDRQNDRHLMIPPGTDRGTPT